MLPPDMILLGISALAVLWCVAIVGYALASEGRPDRQLLDRLVEAFGQALIDAGKELRRKSEGPLRPKSD